MHVAWQGFFIGLALAVMLIAAEYFSVKKQVQGRASPSNPRPQFEPTDRSRIRSVLNFCLFLPPAFAAGAWLLDSFRT